MGFRVYITDSDLGSMNIEAEILTRAGAEVTLLQSRDPAELARRAQDADGLIVQYAPITAELMAALPKLKVIGRYGIGVDNVDVGAASARGIHVCNCPDYCVDEVADHTMALLLTAARRIVSLHRHVAEGGWSLEPAKPLSGLKGAVLGVVGLGRIGQAVASRARAFGMSLLGHDPYLPDERFRALGLRPSTLDDLFTQADYVTLHLPLTPETHHLVNRQRLALMKRGATLINTSRGGLVETDAVVEALESGLLGMAALDVLEQEPAPANHLLRRLPNAILTPHAAYYSETALATLRRCVAEDVARGLAGEVPRNALNRRG